MKKCADGVVPQSGTTTANSVARMAAWSLTDHAVSSALNVLALLVLARNLTTIEFGAAALAVAGYLLAQTLSRALVSEPLLAIGSGGRSHAELVSASSGAAAIQGVLLTIPIGVVAVLASESVRLAFIALAVSLPGLLVLDNLRYVAFSEGRPAKALIVDAIWTVTGLTGLMFLSGDSLEALSSPLLLWLGTASLASLVVVGLDG